MKRFLFAAAIILVAASAFAAADREVLITADGTVYSVSPQTSEDGLTTSLALTVQLGNKTTQTTVPESLVGTNTSPSLAWDSTSKTLFVVWVRNPDDRSSDLLVANYNPSLDRWYGVSVIDSGPVQRSNLAIRFTRQVSMLRGDGTYGNTPALILHAAWWEKAPWGERPYYAVMPLSPGFIYDPDIHDLTEFVATRDDLKPIAGDFMRHVALVPGPTADAVDAIFSDQQTQSFYRMTLRPVAESRVRIPVGVKGPKLGVPRGLAFDWSGRTGTITSPDGNTVIFTNTTDDKVSWITLKSDGTWLPLQSLTLSDKVTVSTAMSALERLAASTSE